MQIYAMPLDSGGSSHKEEERAVIWDHPTEISRETSERGTTGKIMPGIERY